MPKREDDLRERIRRLFAGELSGEHESGTRETPAYWASPAEEVASYRGEAAPCAAERTATKEMMRRWLESPHPLLGGDTPKELLDRGNEADLRNLEKAVAAIEQGAFA